MKRSEKKALKEKELKDSIYKNWGAISKAGKRKYILKFGTLSWAFPTFIIYSIFMFIVTRFMPSAYKYDTPQLLFALIAFMIGGMIYGNLMFNRNERIYRKKYPYKKANKN